MKKDKLLILLWMALAVGSCKKNEEEPSPDNTNEGNTAAEVSASPSFLKVGTAYQYDVNMLFGYDSVYTVIEEQIGDNHFLVRNYTDSPGYLPTQYFKLIGDDLYSSFRMRDEDSYYIECRFGKPVGTKWNVKKNINSYVYEIVGINKTITTKSDKVTDAVKIKVLRLSDSKVSYQYVSPTVGVLGTGNYEDTPTMRLEYYEEGTTPYDPLKTLPAITYGNFDFLKVGNYWELYDEYNHETFDVLIESKLSGKNVYKVKYKEGSDSPYYLYWYEDNGYLVAYEEGEDETEADPVYVEESKAKVGHGWTGMTSGGTAFFYKIASLSTFVTSTAFGSGLKCMAIDVSQGFFVSQTNFWNAEKGQIFIDGFFVFDVIDSNAKRSAGNVSIPFSPIDY